MLVYTQVSIVHTSAHCTHKRACLHTSDHCIHKWPLYTQVCVLTHKSALYTQVSIVHTSDHCTQVNIVHTSVRAYTQVTIVHTSDHCTHKCACLHTSDHCTHKWVLYTQGNIVHTSDHCTHKCACLHTSEHCTHKWTLYTQACVLHWIASSRALWLASAPLYDICHYKKHSIVPSLSIAATDAVKKCKKISVIKARKWPFFSHCSNRCPHLGQNIRPLLQQENSLCFTHHSKKWRNKWKKSSVTPSPPTHTHTHTNTQNGKKIVRSLHIAATDAIWRAIINGKKLSVINGKNIVRSLHIAATDAMLKGHYKRRKTVCYKRQKVLLTLHIAATDAKYEGAKNGQS